MAEPIFKIGEVERINPVTQNNQVGANVTAMSDGGWLATWTSNAADAINIYQQRYDKHGRALYDSDQAVSPAIDIPQQFSCHDACRRWLGGLLGETEWRRFHL